MRVVGEAMVTPDIFRAVLKTLLGRTLLVFRLAGLLLIVLGALSVLTVASTDDLIVGIGGIAIGLAFAVAVPWRTVRLSTRRAAPAIAEPWRYDIDEDIIRIATPIATSDWPWRNMRSFAEHPEFWLLGTPIKRQSVIVVRSAFSPADQQAFAELARRKVGSSTNPS
jgi:hypothetical protein